MLNKDNLYTHRSDEWLAEFEGGYLFLSQIETGYHNEVKLTMARLHNQRGQNITLGQFNDSCKTHGFDKACAVFWKLGVEQQ